ncbi:platelet basic protein-like [Gadus macrocephalus]|uniref:platelet basic protein-like n=1 Tax=Gadus macrocephalus TaxID=80720 RepID=UPI0028CB9609|nr:platelet basic protein-like [Gadus macrocephalus]
MKATMFSLIKVLLLLSLLASLSSAQRPRTNRCLCSSLRKSVGQNLQMINFYEANTFCDTLEIVVTRKDGRRFCLNPNSRDGLYLQRRNKDSTPSSTTPPQ